MSPQLHVVQGDITKLTVDAIVNAANHSLLGGGGVDGAIHRAAGPGLLAECRTLGGCATGEAKITAGYKLPARFVIHTVGPVWQGGTHDEDELLRRCYHHSLALAATHGVQTIAFPSISTGVYGFPIQQAARIALQTIKNFLNSTTTIEAVSAVCFSATDFQIYSTAYQEIFDTAA
ncbi:MAG: O-acetyl-ADP-ribose deacetylase [Chloroflexota bacterium]|nr:O-acetyl-ADP-ribose deacetylase [Chloroflexota bacterium]